MKLLDFERNQLVNFAALLLDLLVLTVLVFLERNYQFRHLQNLEVLHLVDLELDEVLYYAENAV